MFSLAVVVVTFSFRASAPHCKCSRNSLAGSVNLIICTYRAIQLVQVLLACNKLFSKYHAPAGVKLCVTHSKCVLNLPCITGHTHAYILWGPSKSECAVQCSDPSGSNVTTIQPADKYSLVGSCLIHLHQFAIEIDRLSTI